MILAPTYPAFAGLAGFAHIVTAPQPERWQIGLLGRLRERGVLRVAASYAVIAWLLLQIGSVVLDPIGAPRWVMRALIGLSIAGFPIALLLAWFFELTPEGIRADGAPADTPRPHVRGLRRYADLIVIGALALTVTFLLMRDAGWLQSGGGLADASLAVLPFDNVTGRSADVYLATGLADELRSQISRVPSLKVISRSSSEAIVTQQLAAETMADRLGVAALVEGSVQREGKRLRVTASLVDGRDGKVIWSAEFDRTTDDLLTVQSEIAQAIVGAVLPKFVAEGGQVPPLSTTVVSAEDLYLLARHLEHDMKGSERRDHLLKAQELYEQAIAADPRFAAAHAALAGTILALNVEALDDEPERLDQLVLPHVTRALALDRTLAEAYLVKGYLLRNTLRPGGEEMYRLAAELDPNDAGVQEALAGFELNQNRPDSSLEHARRARDLDPLRHLLHWKAVEALMNLGRLDELRHAVARMTDLFGADLRSTTAACTAKGASGDHDEMLACALTGLKRFPDAGQLVAVATEACFRLGDRACGAYFGQRLAASGDEESALWLKVAQRDTSGLEHQIRDGLASGEGHDRGMMYGMVAMAAGLHPLALEAFRAAEVLRATVDDSVRRADAMRLLPEIVLLERMSGNASDSGRQLDAALEWTARGLAHGDRAHDYHLARAQALAVAGRMDEAVTELRAAAAAVDAPFNAAEITDFPSGALLLADPRVPPIVRSLEDRQRRLRERLPATLKAAGILAAEFPPLDGAPRVAPSRTSD